jgi:C-terminal processing protease CtpA/Prc
LKETAILVKADGANDGKRYADLNTFGVGGYFEMFDAYFPLLHPPVNEQYTIKIKKPNAAQAEELKVNTVGRQERSNALLKKNPKHITKADQLWKLEFWDNNTAYLQLGTFDVFQLSFDWSEFLKNAFKEIKKRKIKNLIIDIRWNEGGQDEVLLFIGQNITKQPIKIPQRLYLMRYNKISTELKPYLFTWDNTFFDLSPRTKPYNADYFVFTGENTYEIQPLKNAFEGNTYLLVNGSNSSATFYFAEIAKENKLALLIGEPTGGSQKGLNAGTMFFLRLPYSKIEIDIPIVGTFSDGKPAGGIIPDVLVKPTVEDLINGEDGVLKVTQEMLNDK